MLVAFAFKAKPGREAELERLLNDPESARRVATLLGATRNTLFLREGRVVRILEFPPGAKPRGLLDAAQEDPAVADFLRALGPLVEDGFDYADPESLKAFNARISLPLALDVRADVQAPSRVEM